MSEEMARVERAAGAVRERWPETPRFLLATGSVGDGLEREIEAEAELPYAEIPEFPDPGGELRDGRLLLGRMEGVPLAALCGRYHRYQGHDLRAVTRPVRTGRALGAEVLLITAGCAPLDPGWEVGGTTLISDHINLMGDNPLVGENVDEQGPRFPDMTDAYDPGLRERLRSLALDRGMELREGVYAAVTGPNGPTPAEHGMLRRMGADAAGYSVVPEVIVANHCGMRVAALALIARPGADAASEPGVRRLLRRLVAGGG